MKVGIVGLGLIGGSIARSLRAAGRDVVVSDVDSGAVERAKAAGLGAASSIDELVAASDLVFVCTPLPAIPGVLADIAASGSLQDRTARLVVSDVGSVKGDVVAEANRCFGGGPVGFVGGHPMAGTENSGFDASFDGLFTAATWVLCESETSDLRDISLLMETCAVLGARTTLLDARVHDISVAAVSHVPYVVAAAVALALEELPERDVALRLAAGSFRDVTRVAGSDPGLSTSMLTANTPAALHILPTVSASLDAVNQGLVAGDTASISDFFSRARAIRTQYLEGRGSVEVVAHDIAASDAVAWLRDYCARGGLVHEATLEGDRLRLLVESL